MAKQIEQSIFGQIFLTYPLNRPNRPGYPSIWLFVFLLFVWLRQPSTFTFFITLCIPLSPLENFYFLHQHIINKIIALNSQNWCTNGGEKLHLLIHLSFLMHLNAARGKKCNFPCLLYRRVHRIFFAPPWEIFAHPQGGGRDFPRGRRKKNICYSQARAIFFAHPLRGGRG